MVDLESEMVQVCFQHLVSSLWHRERPIGFDSALKDAMERPVLHSLRQDVVDVDVLVHGGDGQVVGRGEVSRVVLDVHVPAVTDLVQHRLQRGVHQARVQPGPGEWKKKHGVKYLTSIKALNGLIIKALFNMICDL